MPFSMPGSPGIRQAGANLTSQVGNISMRAAENIGNIRMAMARMRAAGITENSQAWQRMLAQLGAIAQAIPQEQRRKAMMQMAIEDQAMQRAREQRQEERQEQLLPLQVSNLTQENELRAVQLEDAGRKLKRDKIRTQVLSESSDPTRIKARFQELGLSDMATEFEQEQTNLYTALAKLSEADIKKEQATVEGLSGLAAGYMKILQTPAADETTKNAAYGRFRDEAIKKYKLPEIVLPKNRDAFADFRAQQLFVEGLTKEQQIMLFKPEEGAKLTALDQKIEEAFVEEHGRKPNATEFLAAKTKYETELSAGRRKPEDEEASQLRLELLRNQVKKAKSPEGEISSSDARLLYGQLLTEVRLRLGPDALPEDVEPEIKKVSEEMGIDLDELNRIRTKGVPQRVKPTEVSPSPALSDREKLVQAKVGEIVSLSDGRKIKKTGQNAFEAVK